MKKLVATFVLLFLLALPSACALVDFPQNVGGKWYFDADSNVHAYIRGGSMEGDPFIPCNIVAHANNEQFVIVAQKPDTECHWNEKDAKIADATNKTGHPINFWIIDIGEDRLIGPLSIDEYFLQRQQLNIPDDLKMDVKI